MTITAPAVTEPKTAACNGSYAAAAGQTTIAVAGLRARGYHVQRLLTRPPQRRTPTP